MHWDLSKQKSGNFTLKKKKECEETGICGLMELVLTKYNFPNVFSLEMWPKSAI